MFMKLLNRVQQMVTSGVPVLHDHLRSWTRLPSTVLTLGCIHDLARSKSQLIIENAVLRQQLIVLNRSVKQLRCTATDRSLLVLLASRVRAWKDALLIVKPDTLLRWY